MTFSTPKNDTEREQMPNVAAELSPEDRRLLDALYDDLIVGPARPTETDDQKEKDANPAPTNDDSAARRGAASLEKDNQMNYLTPTDRRQLEDSGLDLRARELLGDRLDEASYSDYLEALLKAKREQAGKTYADTVAQLAGLASTPDDDVIGESLHRAAESYLRAVGKDNYTSGEYLDAIATVKSVTETQ
jgi:hypothetical protein